MFKCIGLVSFESLVLIAGLFLFAYTRKNEMSKWLQYMAASVTAFVVTLIIGTIFCCCMMCMGSCHGGGRWNQGYRNHGCMKGGMDNNCCNMGGNQQCGPGNSNMNCCSKGGENMDGCNMGMEKEIRIEIDADEAGGKDTVQKKVIIKKNR
jgi:hypothetical protein